MTMTSKLSILHWNSCWLSQHRQAELRHRCIQNSFDVVCICEARLKKAVSCFENYLQICRGDMLVLIRQDVSFGVIDKYTIITDWIEIITLDLGHILLMSVYIRNGNHIDAMRKLFKIYRKARRLYKKIIIIGDLNARSETVGTVNGTNSCGRLLDEELNKSSNELVVLNNDTEYTFNRPGFTSSILDVCLVTEQVLEHVRDFRVLD